MFYLYLIDCIHLKVKVFRLSNEFKNELIGHVCLNFKVKLNDTAIVAFIRYKIKFNTFL